MKVSILDLKPAQLAVGMQEVIEKVEVIRKLSDTKLKKYLKEHPIRVVIAPNKEMYIIDGHHHSSACWQAGVKKIYVNVEHDYSKSKIGYDEFWKTMHMHNWCHLYDKFGDGPRAAMYLPHDIRGLADDPYRSLAWMVKKAGGYEPSDLPFSQFLWANFFRKRNTFERDFDLDYEKAVKVALKAAKSPAAKKLPGYSG